MANCKYGCVKAVLNAYAAVILINGKRNMSTLPTTEELAERNRILTEFDVDAAAKLMPTWMSRQGLIAGMHKARLHIPAIDDKLRKESLDWLRANGFNDYKGAPLPDHLPE